MVYLPTKTGSIIDIYGANVAKYTIHHYFVFLKDPRKPSEDSHFYHDESVIF